MLHTLADVCQWLGTNEETNESLSRQVCKDTACGAWAKVEQRNLTDRSKQTWTCVYGKHQGAWRSVRAMRHDAGGLVEVADPPKDVVDYFLLSGEYAAGVNEHIDSLAPGAVEGAEHSITEETDVRTVIGAQWVFRCGSIVEGTDAETDVVEVVLPCTGEQIDAAIQSVEDQADEIWKDTHGCEECSRLHAAENEEDVGEGDTGGPVHPNCSTCGGDGVVL